MLMMYWQVQRLTREINDLERQAIKVRTRLTHYQDYANQLGANATLFANNVSGLPAELIPRATMFAQYSDQASSMDAMQQMQMMKACGMVPYLNNPMMQYNYEMSAFAQFKKQSLQAAKQREVDVMHEIEKEIETELTAIDLKIKQKTAMKESCEKRLQQRVEDFVPKFGVG